MATCFALSWADGYLLYSDAIARRIYAGSDAFLMPSRFEPCGISQMLALRYGCVPIVRRTGGLVDIAHHVPSTHTGTGYCFDRYEPLNLYTCMVTWEGFQYKENWKALQQRGMSENFSWEQSAKEYVNLCRSMYELPPKTETTEPPQLVTK